MKKLLSADFRWRLEGRREELGLTQIALAAKVVEKTGEPMNQSRISLLENSRADPSLLEVEILALGLGVTPSWLAFGEGREATSGLDEYEPAHQLPARIMERREAPKARARKRGR